MTLALLFEREYEALAASMARQTDAETGEDIASEAFARLARRGNPDPSLLWKIANDIKVDTWRREYSRPDPTGAFALDTDRSEFRTGYAPSFPTEDVILFRADFDRAFRLLPTQCQQTFALTTLRGLTDAEASRVLGMPKSTVTWRNALARELLKGSLT